MASRGSRVRGAILRLPRAADPYHGRLIANRNAQRHAKRLAEQISGNALSEYLESGAVADDGRGHSQKHVYRLCVPVETIDHPSTSRTSTISISSGDDGAQERTRTFTAVKPLAPEASASTNSATWARARHVARCVGGRYALVKLLCAIPFRCTGIKAWRIAKRSKLPPFFA